MILEIQNYKDHNNKSRKRCLVECDTCHTQGWRNDYYAVKNLSTHVCRSCNNKIQGSLRLGTPSPFKGSKRKKDNEYLVGGTYINSSGYIEEYVGRHTYSDKKGGYYLQHRKVVEDKLKRRLTKEEKVHHINGTKTDNDVSNLFVCNNMSKHKLVHDSLEKTAFELYKKGFIVFDIREGIYRIAPTIGDN